MCDAVEVGIIGNLEFDMYDVIILAWGSEGSDVLPVVDFRMSHLNDRYLAWFAIVRLSCLFVTAVIMALYFLRTCRKSDIQRFISVKFNFEQNWVIMLLFICIFYDEPFFEYRRSRPSIVLAVISEIPSSIFFTALLTYWLMGLAYVRAKVKKVEQATFRDIIGEISPRRLLLLLIFFAGFTLS